MSSPPHNRKRTLPSPDKLYRLSLGLLRLPLAVVSADADGMIDFVNDKFTEITGYEADEALGRSLWTLQCPESASCTVLEKSVINQGDWHGEMVSRRKNGAPYWESVSISVVRDNDGMVSGYVAVKQDVSDEKRTEERLKAREAELSEAQRIARVGSWTLEAESDKVYWSEQTFRICGFDQAEAPPSFYGGYAKLFYPEDLARLTTAVDHAMREGTPYQLDLQMLCPDTPRWITVRGEAVRDAEGRIKGIRGSIQDISDRKRGEDALRESEERYRLLFTNMTEGFAIGEARLTDAGSPCDFVLLEINPAFEHHTGLSREIVGKSAREAFPQLEEHWADSYCKVATTGEPVKFQSYNKDTDRFYDIYAYSPARGRFAVIATDISERKKAEDALRASEEKFRAFFEHAGIGMGRVSFTDARWIDVNGAFCRMLGYTSEYLKATPWPHISHPEDVDLDLIPFRRMAAGEVDNYVVEKRFIHKDNHHVWAHLTLSLVRDAEGRPDYEIAVIEDITERKRSEVERERLLAEVQRSNQELQQFVYIASHDLQEPLRMISSYISLLEKKYSDQLDGKAKTYINYAVDGAVRMQKLIDGLLNYSRISREAELVPLDANAAFAAAVANLDQRIRESGGRVTNDPLPTVLGDETQLVQLFQNLIGNALKYGKPGTPPCVHVSARREGAGWLFSVSDNGIGIELQHYDRIFQIFQRLHTQEEIPGTGIGLASCKKIVERHGGRISVESKPGEGSTFYFTLPAEH